MKSNFRISAEAYDLLKKGEDVFGIKMSSIARKVVNKHRKLVGQFNSDEVSHKKTEHISIRMSQDQLQYLRTSGESREEAMEIAILKILPKEIENAVRRRGKPFETAYLPDLDYTIKGEK